MKRIYSAAKDSANTIDRLAQKVAGGFKETMAEEGFDTFDEMKQCYWWDSSDIKEEITYMVNHMYGSELGLMCDDSGSILGIDDDAEMPYRKFRLLVSKYLKESTDEEDEE